MIAGSKHIIFWLLLLPIMFILNVNCSYCQPGAGYSLSFDGTSNRIVYENLLNDIQLPFTLSHWVKVNEKGTATNYVFASCLDSENWYYGFWNYVNLDAMGVSYGDGKGALQPAYRRSKRYFFEEDISNKWIHCAFVVRGPTDMSIHLNGVDVGGSYHGSGEAEIANGSDCQTPIGFLKNNNGEFYFNGALDELRIWNYDRSTEEIRRDMCRRLTGDETGLVAYWRFDKGEGQTLEIENRNEAATIGGTANWDLSGAAVGDESFYDYSLTGTTDSVFFKNGSNSFFISTENPNDWIGYQIYKVNEEPNTTIGANVSFENGYYGIYPVFSDAKTESYSLSLTSSCSKGNYRFGNDDQHWQEINLEQSSPTYNAVLNTEVVTELSAENLEVLYNIEICAGESIILDVESECVDSFLWWNGSKSHQVTIDEPGNYWLERTIGNQKFRNEFEVTTKSTVNDFFTVDTLDLCPVDYPITLPINEDSVNYENIFSLSKGIIDGEVFNPGAYWVEYHNNCHVVSDTITVVNTAERSDLGLFLKEEISICLNDFPYQLPVNADIIKDVVLLAASDGIENGLVENGGIFWIEYLDNCAIKRDSISISLVDVTFDELPNAFTPNDDNINDFFEIDPILTGSSLKVYSRSGNLIYAVESYHNTWNGSDLPPGSYYYILKEKCGGLRIKGWVTILR